MNFWGSEGPPAIFEELKMWCQYINTHVHAVIANSGYQTLTPNHYSQKRYSLESSRNLCVRKERERDISNGGSISG